MLLRLLGLISAVVVAATGCKSDSGHDVDWWVAIKAPKGTDYLYADSANPSTLALSLHSMNDTDTGALAHTARQLWDPATAYVVWNDEPAGEMGYNFSYGHTKGILTDTFWLVHSIPLWPAGPASVASYQGLGSNAWTYAQSAACFTINSTATLNSMGDIFQLYHPHIYDVGATPSSASSVQALAAGAIRTEATCASAALALPDVEGRLYGKTPAWNADLWSACVAPKEGVDLWVQSWLRGSEEGPACNGSVWTTDVEEMDYGGGYTWSEYNDHGKWATDPAGTVFCIGGINRMTTQYSRAGGAICWHTPLASAFANAVTSAGKC